MSHSTGDLKVWNLENWMERMTRPHGVNISEKCNEHFFNIKEKHQTIELSSWNYPVGISFVLLKMYCQEEYYLQLHDNNTEAPLLLAFVQSGQVTNEVAGKETFVINSGFNSVSSAETGQERYFKVASGIEQQLALIFVNRRKYLDHVNCSLEEVRPSIKEVIQDMEGRQSFYLNQPYSNAVAVEISSAFANNNVDIVRYSSVEAHAMSMLAHQIMVYEKGAMTNGHGRKNSDDLKVMIYAHTLLISDLANAPTIAELAKMLGINQQKLKTGYKQFHGMTIMRHLRQVRMQKAYELLSTGNISVAEVAERVGYTSRSHFARRFRENFNQSPRDLLKKKNVESSKSD